MKHPQEPMGFITHLMASTWTKWACLDQVWWWTSGWNGVPQFYLFLRYPPGNSHSHGNWSLSLVIYLLKRMVFHSLISLSEGNSYEYPNVCWLNPGKSPLIIIEFHQIPLRAHKILLNLSISPLIPINHHQIQDFKISPMASYIHTRTLAVRQFGPAA